MALPQHRFIEDAVAWGSCLEQLNNEPIIAIDLEANSLFAYREQVCLIQISIPDQDYIIDPIAGFSFDEFENILLNPSIEKIFHAAEYDLILLKRQFGWQMTNLFDTMWAARILGLPRCGLANLLAEFYSVQHNKKHQKANWCKRPLTQDQLKYAQIDTHYLIRLRNDMSNRLDREGRLQEAREIFAEQTNITLPDNSFDPENFWRINGIKDLPDSRIAAVRALNLYRDHQAKKQNRPPFKVFHDRTLVEIARAAPRTLDDFKGIHGMSPGQVRRYGRSIISVVASTANGPIPKRQRNNHQRPPEAVAARYEQLHKWRKLRAKERGVESDVIISRGALWTLARTNPKSLPALEAQDTLGAWRFQEYGSEILTVLEESR